MKKQLQKLSSILLCFVMLLSLLPTTALAAGEIDKVELTLDVPTIGNTLDFKPTTGAENYKITWNIRLLQSLLSLSKESSKVLQRLFQPTQNGDMGNT